MLGNTKDAHSHHKISQNFHQQNYGNVFMFKTTISGRLWRGLGHVNEPGGELGGLFSSIPQAWQQAVFFL